MRNKVTYFLIFLIAGSALAQEVSFSGFGTTGMKIYNRNILNGYNQEMYYEAKLQANIDYNKKIDSQIDMRGNSVDNSIQLREATISFKYFKRLKIKFGNPRTPFGYEQTTKREDLISIDRSMTQDRLADIGYGGRGVGLTFYYNYDDDEEDFPYTYAATIFKNNSLLSGLVGRFVYFPDDDLGLGVNYQFSNLGGDYSVNSQGIGIDIIYDKKRSKVGGEIFIVQDPFENSRRKLINIEESAVSFAANINASYKFDTEAEVIKDIEPFFIVSFFLPDLEIETSHEIQTLVGANFYLNKKVRFRFNVDLRFKKNQFNENYSTDNSIFMIESQFLF
ncbi:MAG: OprO/OprP family phosphate-selective porin [Melioribacteraceae bacterium]|nr:OprO/OprP family phosphate-selective porin [Melioribacteraceae bacterium]MCF8264706.1 OprO/OprP family phosphate-selective porin [Melioribacteraceae bacterium]